MLATQVGMVSSGYASGAARGLLGASVTRLGGLTNYSFTYVEKSATRFSIVARVHGPDDWEETATIGSTVVSTYDINGRGFSLLKGLPQVESVHFASPRGLHHLNGESIWATTLLEATHVPGVKVVSSGSCRVAGQTGDRYVVSSPSASASIFSLTDVACVGRGSGALLSFNSGVNGGSGASAVGLTGRSQTFTVTAVGSVGAISSPVAKSPSGAASAGPAFGTPVVLGGLGNDRVAVTPTKWIARATTSYPAPGYQYEIVEVRLTEVGTGEWSPTAEAIAGLETPGGAIHPNVYAEAALMSPPCPGLSGAPTLTHGASTSACAIFAIPTGTSVNRFVVTLRSGNSLATGSSATWRLP